MGATPQHRPEEGLNGAVAAVLRGERAAAGVTVKQVSELSGIPAVTVQRLLPARRPITVENLKALSHALGRSPAEIMALAEAREVDPDLMPGAVARRATDAVTSKDEDNGAHPVRSG